MDITGWPMQVWVRGTLTCDAGRLVMPRGGGQYLQRERSSVVTHPDALPRRKWVS